MNINRHNYEEFFLLYVDNELSTGQRKIVEAFVAVNPDLQEEFQLIQQSTFTADEKLDSNFITSLLKPVDEETTISEEQLLRYIDHELKPGEQKEVEKAIVENPRLQKELQWLKRSILEADASIVFPDKSLLYKEAHPASVFYMSTAARRWSAAAAVILLVGSAMWLMLDQSTDPKNTTAVNKPIIKKEENKNTPVDTQSVKEQSQQTVAQQTVDEKTNNTATDNNNIAPIQKKEVMLVKNDAVKKQEQKNSQQPNEQESTVAKIETPVTTVSENNSSTTRNKTETPTVQPLINTASTMTYASYNNDGTDENEHTIFTEERQRRSGLKGMVKKAKRMFERNTGIQSNASEVRFAVFAVNTQ